MISKAYLPTHPFMIYVTFKNFSFPLWEILVTIFLFFGKLTEIQQAVCKVNREKTYKTYLKVFSPCLCSKENFEYLEPVKTSIFFILRIHPFQKNTHRKEKDKQSIVDSLKQKYSQVNYFNKGLKALLT